MVTLVNGANFISTLAIADTGADHCIFPLSFASVLGLDRLRMKSQATSGMGSYNVPTYYADVTLRIGFCGQIQEHSFYAGFTQGLEQQGIGLLGQFGFFDHFKVMFDRPNSVFYVEIPDQPAPTPPAPVP